MFDSNPYELPLAQSGEIGWNLPMFMSTPSFGKTSFFHFFLGRFAMGNPDVVQLLTASVRRTEIDFDLQVEIVKRMRDSVPALPPELEPPRLINSHPPIGRSATKVGPVRIWMGQVNHGKSYSKRRK